MMRGLRLVLPLAAAHSGAALSAELLVHSFDESALLQVSAETVAIARDVSDFDAGVEQAASGLPPEVWEKDKLFFGKLKKGKTRMDDEAKEDAQFVARQAQEMSKAMGYEMLRFVKEVITGNLNQTGREIQTMIKDNTEETKKTLNNIADWTMENIKHNGISYKTVKWAGHMMDKASQRAKHWLKTNIDWQKFAASMMLDSSATGLKTTDSAQQHIERVLRSSDLEGLDSEVLDEVKAWMEAGGGQKTISEFLQWVKDRNERSSSMASEWFDKSVHLQRMAAGSLATLAGKKSEDVAAGSQDSKGELRPIPPSKEFTKEYSEVVNSSFHNAWRPIQATGNVSKWLYANAKMPLPKVAGQIGDYLDASTKNASHWFQQNLQWQDKLRGSLDATNKLANETAQKVKSQGENTANMMRAWFDNMAAWQKAASGTLAKAAAKTVGAGGDAVSTPKTGNTEEDEINAELDEDFAVPPEIED